MPEKRECTFCGNPIEPGTGTLHIMNNGQVFHFCNSKCKRNMLDMDRKARETRWTKRHAQEKAVKTYRKKDEKEEEEGGKKILKKKD
ncbi:MAG: 50S ribosomal protein L24e [Candidatus Thermoplasmatota archaeon]